MEVIKDFGAITLVETEVGKVFTVKYGGRPYVPDWLLFRIAENNLYGMEVFAYDERLQYIKYYRADTPEVQVYGFVKITPKKIDVAEKRYFRTFNCVPTRIYFTNFMPFDYVFEACGKYYGYSSRNLIGERYEMVEKRGNLICAKRGVCDSIISMRNVKNPKSLIRFEHLTVPRENKRLVILKDMEIENFGNYVLYKLYDDENVCAVISKEFSTDVKKVSGIALTCDMGVRKWKKGKLENGSL